MQIVCKCVSTKLALYWRARSSLTELTTPLRREGDSSHSDLCERYHYVITIHPLFHYHDSVIIKESNCSIYTIILNG